MTAFVGGGSQFTQNNIDHRRHHYHHSVPNNDAISHSRTDYDIGHQYHPISARTLNPNIATPMLVVIVSFGSDVPR